MKTVNILLIATLTCLIGLSLDYLRHREGVIGHRPGFRITDNPERAIHPKDQKVRVETGEYWSNRFGLLGGEWEDGKSTWVTFGSSSSMRYPAVLQEMMKDHGSQVFSAARTGLSIRGVLQQLDHLGKEGMPSITVLFMGGGGLLLDFEMGWNRCFRFTEFQINQRAFSWHAGGALDWLKYRGLDRWGKIWYGRLKEFPFRENVYPMSSTFSEDINAVLKQYEVFLEQLVTLCRKREHRLLLMTSAAPRDGEHQPFENMVDAINPITRKVAEREGVLLLDLDQKFSDLKKGAYFKDGFHWNEKGDKMASGWIMAKLLKNLGEMENLR